MTDSDGKSRNGTQPRTMDADGVPAHAPMFDGIAKQFRMRVLNMYVFRAMFTTFMMALLVITFMMVMGSLVQIMALIFKNVSVWVIFELLGVILPSVICYSLPFSMAAASLLVFSRLSADGEITAMKATGISILRIAAPPLAFSVVIGLIALPAQNNLLPSAYFRQSNILANYRHADASSLIETGTVTPISKYRFFVSEKEGNKFRNITIIEDLDGGRSRHINAERGFVRNLRAENRVLFELYDVTTEERSKDRTNTFLRMTAGRVDMYIDMGRVFTKGKKVMEKATKPGHKTTDELYTEIATNMSRIAVVEKQAGKSFDALIGDIRAGNSRWSQLQRQPAWRTLLKERGIDANKAWDEILGSTNLYPITTRQGVKTTVNASGLYAQRIEALERGRGQASRLFSEWRTLWPQPVHNILGTCSRNKTEIMKRFSYAFACFAFAIIGIPLGIRAHRSERTIGWTICLALIAVHYALVVIFNTFSESYLLRPDLLIWLPDILFVLTGSFLLWRIHKHA